MKKTGFDVVFLAFLFFFPLFASEGIVKSHFLPPDVTPLIGNMFVSYPFDIIIGRRNPFINDSNVIFYSDRISDLVVNGDGDCFPLANTYNGNILSRLLYGKYHGNTLFGFYLTHGYFANISGKTALTSFNYDSTSNYLIYQNIKWDNGYLPLTAEVIANYNKDSINYTIGLSGYDREQFFNIEYFSHNFTLDFANRIKNFLLKGQLNTRDTVSKFGLFFPLFTSIFNRTNIGASYDPYNNYYFAEGYHTLRLDSKSMVRSGCEYRFRGAANIYASYYRTHPYIYSSIHYYLPSDSLNLLVFSVFNRRYFKGYVKGEIKYDSVFTYSLISYAKIIWQPKRDLFFNPGLKTEGYEGKIEVIPVIELKFINASLYTSYNLYYKSFSVVGKWDFFN